MSASGGRHTKGVNLIDLVKTFRALHKAGQITNLPPDETRFLQERILVSSRYPLEDFLRIAHRVHTAMGGTVEVAETMGGVGAQSVLQGVHRIFLREGDPAGTVRAIQQIWANHFDFGEIQIEEDGHCFRVRMTGYPDMPPIHGHIVVGWVRKAVELAGGDPKSVSLERAPWREGGDFVIRVTPS
jgi:hypothetical protein